MADRDPARALDMVKRVVEMCDFIENPAIQKAVLTKMGQLYPVTAARRAGADGAAGCGVVGGSEALPATPGLSSGRGA